MNDVAKAINIVQTATGCHVMLVPIAGDTQPAPTQNAILKPVEAASGPVKAVGASSSRVAQKAVKSASEDGEKRVKHTKKATKPAKEKAATFMTVPQFADLKGMSTACVYAALHDGRLSAEMVNKTSGRILIDSRADFAYRGNNHNRNPIKVFCNETKTTFASITQAVKATGLDAKTIRTSLDKGITTRKGLTFTRV